MAEKDIHFFKTGTMPFRYFHIQHKYDNKLSGCVSMANRRRRRTSPSLCIFPGYRWCGPGCSGPGAPINDVDSCCYRHDRCLDRGISPCRCDIEFIHCLRSKKNGETLKGRQAALMYHVMKLKASFFC